MSLVDWHDTECGNYGVDLALWRELAGTGPVLDVGAGTGRVALDLAGLGIAVTALDREPELLAELERRAAAEGLAVETVVADAGGFDLGDARFAAILVPMQTVQLLPDRAGFFAAARRHLAPGGVVALAIVTHLESFDPADGPLPPPDTLERGGRRFSSQPVAVRPGPTAARIERLRRVDDGPGQRDVLLLATVTADGLEREAESAGLRPGPRRQIPPTPDHVGSTVLVLRG